jgi:hypothetical protein
LIEGRAFAAEWKELLTDGAARPREGAAQSRLGLGLSGAPGCTTANTAAEEKIRFITVHSAEVARSKSLDAVLPIHNCAGCTYRKPKTAVDRLRIGR